MFPFTFGGVEHTKCTMDQSVNGLAWCATEVNETTGETMSGRWSDCRSESCPIECTCPEEELSLVCGQDGITYSSECAAHCEKVALNYPGECLPEGGQCRFSQDCRNFSSCSNQQDASCVCLHGTCEVQVGSLNGFLFFNTVKNRHFCTHNDASLKTAPHPFIFSLSPMQQQMTESTNVARRQDF